MDIKMLALDLDDTLLDEQGRITSRAEKAVKTASEAGVKIILTTGRPYVSAEKYMRQLELDMPVISNGGAEIFHKGKRIFSSYLTSKMAKELISFTVKEGVHYQIYRNEYFCYEKENEYSALYRKSSGMTGLEIPDLRYQDNETPKLIIIDREEKILNLYRKAKLKFGNRFNTSTSKPIYLEFNGPDVSKGAALKYLAGIYDLQSENIMAVGDGLIDLSMIEFAGLGIAMANSPNIVRKKADFITDSNREEGVAKAIEKFIL